MRAVREAAVLLTLPFLAGCADLVGGNDSRDPTNLTWSVTTETTGGTIGGIMLRWDPPRARDAWSYAVFGRASTAGEWYLIGITTSTTFHDAGAPQRQYVVVARDEDDVEFGRTRTITIELAAALAAPEGLHGVSLNGAVQLAWLDNARQAGGSAFRQYRVFSTALTATGGCDPSRWVVEGATISASFHVTALANGVTRCFGVTAVNQDGIESAMSRTWVDTPRPDARNVALTPFQSASGTSGFLFHEPATATFGAVVDGARADLDFRVERAGDGTMRLQAIRDAVRIASVGTGPVADLTSVDVAPATGYTLTSVPAEPGHAFAFRITRADGVRYGALRIAYVTATHVVLDWAYQPALGNPELAAGTFH